MSCERELRKVQLAAPPRSDAEADIRGHLFFRVGYLAGYHDALREALEIVEEHEEDE